MLRKSRKLLAKCIYRFLLLLKKRVRRRLRSISRRSCVKAFWFDREANFGDLLAPFIIERLTGKKAEWVDYRHREEHFVIVGSVLRLCNERSIVWGAGFMDSKEVTKVDPKNLHGVRGPLSLQMLEKSSVGETENIALGDPAVLLPRLYAPRLKRIRYDIGIIPHYVDQLLPVFRNTKKLRQVTFIDVLRRNPLEVIDDIVSCRLILSSSLHGIILAEAYSIPAIWVLFHNHMVSGSRFKFDDYYLSTGRAVNPFNIDTADGIFQILSYSNTIPMLSRCVESLMECCPLPMLR